MEKNGTFGSAGAKRVWRWSNVKVCLGEAYMKVSGTFDGV